MSDKNNNESNSISNQRLLIKDYIDSNISASCILEFIDDGYSGTNLNRPAFKRLIDSASNGSIDCIVVKDFSRFCRNYMDMGIYLEEIFPNINLRFISINDKFDSGDNALDFIDTSFKNLMYDIYSKDLSYKVRQAKEARARDGKFINAYPIFGYKKTLDNNITKDEESSKIVENIFELCVAGYSTSQISKYLNDNLIPTPAEFKRMTGHNRSWNEKTDSAWSRHSVTRIIRDVRYNGTMVYSKRQRIFGEGSKSKKSSSQIVIKNNHPPIVNDYIFFEANSKLKNHRPKNYVKNILSKKVICSNCGNIMHKKSTKNSYYYCPKSAENQCYNSRISESILKNILLLNIIYQIYLLDIPQSGKLFSNMLEIKREKADMLILYENFKNNKISFNEFSINSVSKPPKDTPCNRIDKPIEEDIIPLLIDRVIVENENAITINFAFNEICI